MKLTFFLTLFTCLQIHASVFSQKVSLNVKDAPLSDVIAEIGKQSGYAFFYDASYLKNANLVTVKIKKVPLSEALNSIFAVQPFTWDVTDNLITITAKKTVQPLKPAGYFADIRGKIVDVSGDPLPGAVVKVKGTTKTAIANVNGDFELKEVDGDAILVVSYTGYVTQEVALNNSKTLRITLKEDPQNLSEVSVVAYGTQKRESVVGAISTVRIGELKTPTRNLQNVLAGKVAGVISVQRSGEPGFDDAQFWIRGISTIGSGSAPLVLVDGVERPINNIEPEEIETFSVLKDAAATSVYGVRAANGVILVTTKRGTNDKPSINFKYEQGIVGTTGLPELARAGTYLELFNEANLASNPNFVSQYTPDIIAKHVSGEDPYLYPDVDWVDLLMKKWSDNRRANLNISGGSSTARYFVSATYYMENGIYKGDNLNQYNTNVNLKRYNFRANTDINLSKTTELSLGLGGILVTQNIPGGYAGNSTSAPSATIWGNIMLNTPVGYPATYPDETGEREFLYAGINGTRNPLQLLTGRGFTTTWANNITSDIMLKQDLSGITKGLKVQGKFAFDGKNNHNILRSRDNADTYIATGRDAVTNELLLNKWLDAQDDLSFAREGYGNRRIYTQLDFTYNRIFGNHTVGGLLLYNQQDFQNADITVGNAIAALPYRMQGFASRASYSYKNKYFAEFTAGYNGSENFEKGKRFGFFPAFAGAWIVSEEPIFKNNVKAVEFLKLRASFGFKGNDQIGGRRFAYLTTLGGGNGGYNFGIDNNNSFAGRGEDQWGADLTWEREKELNLGIELRFLKGFYLQTDVFSRHRSGIFLQRNSLPLTMGLLTNPYGNVGEFKNKGFESTLEYRKKLGAFDVSFRGNFTFARNKVVNNDQAEPRFFYQDRQGQRHNTLYGLVADGLFMSEDEIKSSARQTYGTVRPGDIKYKDINGDGVVDAFDEVNIGNPTIPEMIYGFGTTLAFKGFDLSVFFQGAGNVSFMLSGGGWFPFETTGLRGNLNVNALNRWTPSNPSQDVLFPRLSYGTNTNNYRNSTWWLRDADYLRLRTAEFGYTFPKKLTQRVKVNTLRLYVSGFNLLTFSKFDFWDPELGNGRGAAYPLARTFNAGVNLNF